MTLIGILAKRLPTPTGGGTTPTPPPDPGTTVATWEFNGNGNITGTGNAATLTGVETGVGSLVNGDSGGSIALDGSVAQAVSNHHQAYSIPVYTVAQYFQPARMPADGTQETVVLMDDASLPPGGWAINIRNDAGTLRLVVFRRNDTGGSGSGIFSGPQTGVGTLSLNTGYLVALACGADGGELFLRAAGGAAQSLDTDPDGTNGMATLTLPIVWGNRVGGQIFQGVIDRFALYNFKMTLAEFSALPPPISTSWTPPSTEPPPPSESDQKNCFVESGADTVVVSTMANLESAVNAAPPGRQILIASGTYNGTTLVFNRDGTEANPIVIRPQGAMGSVTINAGSWTMANTSSWLVISKLNFTGNARIVMMGDHNRVTRCLWSDFSGRNHIGDPNDTGGARDCRWDHNEHTTATVSQNAINLRGSASYGSGNCARNLIDYCYFHDFGANDTSAIESFGDTSGAPLDGVRVARGQSVTVDHCLFHNITMTGEFICAKIGGMIYRFCTYSSCRGYWQTRQMDNGELRSCWFEGGSMGETKMWGKNHLVIGNRFIGSIPLWVPAGRNTSENLINLTQVNDTNVVDDYLRANGTRVIGNRFGSGTIQVGQYFNGNNPSAPQFVQAFAAVNNVLEANTRDSGAPAHVLISSLGTSPNVFSPAQTGTVVNATTSEQFTAAVKLAPADVGRNAPDPLCS